MIIRLDPRDCDYHAHLAKEHLDFLELVSTLPGVTELINDGLTTDPRISLSEA